MYFTAQGFSFAETDKSIFIHNCSPGFFVSFLSHERKEKPAWLEGNKSGIIFPLMFENFQDIFKKY